MNVVIVRELEPPEGQAPIEWRLLTSESIETTRDILRVVDRLHVLPYRCIC